MPLRIAIAATTKEFMGLYLARRGLPITEDALEEYDSLHTVRQLQTAIERLGHHTYLVSWGPDFQRDLERVRPDLVYNIAEGYGGRSREAQVPALLEMLGIPYVGSDVQALTLAMDKALFRAWASSLADVVPRGFKLSYAAYRAGYGGPVQGAYPFILKPAREGSSRGVFPRSVVHSQQELMAIARELFTTYEQDIAVEEYLPGAEYTVGLVGHTLRVFGVLRIAPTEDEKEFVYSLEHKRDWERRVTYSLVPADSEEATHVAAAAMRVAQGLGCVDVCRIDVRCNALGHARVIDVNPLPGLNPESSDICIMANKLGVSYQGLVGRILEGAIQRAKLDLCPRVSPEVRESPCAHGPRTSSRFSATQPRFPRLTRCWSWGVPPLK